MRIIVRQFFCINYIAEPVQYWCPIGQVRPFRKCQVGLIFYWLYLTQIRFFQSSVNSIHHIESDLFKLDVGHYRVCF